MHRAALAIALVACFALPTDARAGEAYDACTGFIDTLPAVISLPGTWCVRKDLTFAVNDDTAITISANDVTLDCNGFRLTNLATGETRGVYYFRRDHVTVRDCSIRGFDDGAFLWGSGTLVEDNRFENNQTGLTVVEQANGDLDTGLSTVRRNRITDSSKFGIYTSGASVVSDNIVDGVDGSTAVPTAVDVIGIYAEQGGSVIERNIVRNITASGTMAGITGNLSPNIMIRDNVVIEMPGTTAHNGIICSPSGSAMGNQTSGYTVGIAICAIRDNHVTP